MQLYLGGTKNISIKEAEKNKLKYNIITTLQYIKRVEMHLMEGETNIFFKYWKQTPKTLLRNIKFGRRTERMYTKD